MRTEDITDSLTCIKCKNFVTKDNRFWFCKKGYIVTTELIYDLPCLELDK